MVKNVFPVHTTRDTGIVHLTLFQVENPVVYTITYSFIYSYRNAYSILQCWITKQTQIRVYIAGLLQQGDVSPLNSLRPSDAYMRR